MSKLGGEVLCLEKYADGYAEKGKCSRNKYGTFHPEITKRSFIIMGIITL